MVTYRNKNAFQCSRCYGTDPRRYEVGFRAIFECIKGHALEIENIMNNRNQDLILFPIYLSLPKS